MLLLIILCAKINRKNKKEAIKKHNHGKFNNVIVVLDYQKSEQKYEIFIICNNLEPARKIKKNKIK